jgi:tetratricopeptide (TPR) repeat protein
MQELISCLQQQERPNDTIELLHKLKAANPDDQQIGLLIAIRLDKLGRTEEAAEQLKALTAKHPENVAAWLAYAHNLRSAGQTDASVQAYRRVTEIDAERGDAWWGLASIRKKVLSDADIATMQQALSIAIDVANVAPLHFALARAWHERGEYEKAFHHYSEGNRVRAEALNYNSQELSQEVDQVKQIFDRAYFEPRVDGGDPSDAPIFIVSLPRSGSTLLEQMLGNHPDIEPLGELPYAPALLRSVMEKATRRGITTIPEAIKALSPEDRTALGREYLRRAALHRKTDAERFIDKLPHNWSNILLIHSILPNARFLDIRRQAMDCCFSNFTQSFSRAHASSFALADIGQCYVDYVRYMDHLDAVAPGLVHHVRYEQLIEEPEPELREIFNYLDLEWSDEPLNFHQSGRAVRTPSAEQVRQPLNRKGVGVWKPYEQWLGPLREVLGPLADA